MLTPDQCYKVYVDNSEVLGRCLEIYNNHSSSIILLGFFVLLAIFLIILLVQCGRGIV